MIFVTTTYNPAKWLISVWLPHSPYMTRFLEHQVLPRTILDAMSGTWTASDYTLPRQYICDLYYTMNRQ